MTPLLQVTDLVRRFGALVATDHATIDVTPGEIHALIGPNGAGKTTLINQLSGSLKPSSGSIRFDGQEVTEVAMDRRARAGLVRSYQITQVFQRLSVRDNLAMAVLAREGHCLRFWRNASLETGRYAEAASLGDQVGLGQVLDATAGALSHGQQRQLELGLALALRPKLLLLDEPMAGMGPEESERMVDLLQQLRAQCTMLLVEHDMDAVFRLADRVSVLVAGKVIETGLPDQIRRSSQVRQAYLGDELTPDDS